MHRRELLIGGAALLLALPRRAGAAPSAPLRVVLQPLEPVPASGATAFVSRAITALYGFEVVVAAPQPMPARAWYAPRERWRAERLLLHLNENLPEGAHRVLGLTGADISTTKPPVYDWGLLGLADIGGRAGVLSTFRTVWKVPAKVAHRRFAKVAVHELGHTLGLEHCPTVGCLMEDANAKVATCDRETDLCGVCRGKLAMLGTLMPPPLAPGFWEA